MRLAVRAEEQVDREEQQAGGEGRDVRDVECGVDGGEEESDGEEGGSGGVGPEGGEECGEEKECGEVEGRAEEEEDIGCKVPGQDGEGRESDDGRWRVDGVVAGGICVDGAGRRSGGVPGGEEGGCVVGVLMLEPESAGDVGGGEVVDVSVGGAERSAKGEDSACEEDDQPGEERGPSGAGVGERNRVAPVGS